MSEVMITRRGGSGGSSGGSGKLKTEFILYNQNWVVPSGVINNEFSVRLFGAGGLLSASTSSDSWGGAGGWMNNDVFTNLVSGSEISITIGKCMPSGVDDSTGETTSFGTYLSAAGGTAYGQGGAAGVGPNSIAYQFGGAAAGSYANKASNGGIWGGGGSSAGRATPAGNGGTYGGGGSKYYWSNRLTAGNGGTYGGGGGGFIEYTISYNIGYGGRGGTYGGNGGNGLKTTSYSNLTVGTHYTLAQNGINTSTWTNVYNDGNEYFRGWGKGGNYCGGGGGYGGNGGDCDVYMKNDYWYTIYGGGGGGYGSNGGLLGGGGGYGGDGNMGGGGYGKTAKGSNTGGGGGYYCPGQGQCGGGYGLWSGTTLLANFGSGGWYNRSKGVMRQQPTNGICIIQYYV